jgi:hypothetical protein
MDVMPPPTPPVVESFRSDDYKDQRSENVKRYDEENNFKINE